MLSQDGREPARPAANRRTHRFALVLSLLFVLAAVGVSSGLVVYTAWHHELWNGFFALIFAVLSTKAALLWTAWKDQPTDDPAKPRET